ncbi:MAG: amidohydrolase [Pelolinea sp.]|nr:amidohydrolase [Pelolinea sp.]
MKTLLIKNGYLLDSELTFGQADLLIEGDTITQIASNIQFDADMTINAKNKVIIPGLINAHSHSTQALFKGMDDNLPLEPWLIFDAFSGNELSPRDLYVAAAIGAIELLKTGTTAILDNPGFAPFNIVSKTEAIINAYIDVGIRSIVAPITDDQDVFLGFPFHILPDLKTQPRLNTPIPSINELESQLRELLKKWPKNRHPRVNVFIGPMGPGYSTKEFLNKIVELSNDFDTGIHTHLLETKAELIAGWNKFSESPVKYLENIGWLSPKASFAHGVWLNNEDFDILAEHECSIVHNPISNLKLGSGIAPVQTMKSRKLNVALGADDASANDSANMFDVMKFSGLIHKLYGPYKKWLGGFDAFWMCVKGGAKIFNKKIGYLRSGYLADLTILNTNSLFMMPKENFINQLVFSENGSSVDTVIVNGDIVVEGGKMTTVNEAELRYEAQEIIHRTYKEIGIRVRALKKYENELEKMLKVVKDCPIGFSRLVEN